MNHRKVDSKIGKRVQCLYTIVQHKIDYRKSALAKSFQFFLTYKGYNTERLLIFEDRVHTYNIKIRLYEDDISIAQLHFSK